MAPFFFEAFSVFMNADDSIGIMQEMLKQYEEVWDAKKSQRTSDIEDYIKKHGISHTPHDFENSRAEALRSRAYFSVFIGTYSIVESYLLKICKLIESEFPFKIKLKDLGSRKYLDQYKTYLTKVYGLENQVFEKYYPQIGKYAILRNTLLHEDGETLDKDLKKKLNGIKGIKFDESTNALIVNISDDTFFTSFFDTVEDFIIEISELIDLKYLDLRGE